MSTNELSSEIDWNRKKTCAMTGQYAESFRKEEKR